MFFTVMVLLPAGQAWALVIHVPGDYPTIQAVVMLYTFLFLGLNLVMDCLYAVLDPRVRYS